MEEYIRIATLENIVEAQLLDSLLQEQDIPHSIQSFHDPAYDGMFQLQQGWGCVIGPADQQKAILFILSGLRQDGGRSSES